MKNTELSPSKINVSFFQGFWLRHVIQCLLISFRFDFVFFLCCSKWRNYIWNSWSRNGSSFVVNIEPRFGRAYIHNIQHTYIYTYIYIVYARERISSFFYLRFFTSLLYIHSPDKGTHHSDCQFTCVQIDLGLGFFFVVSLFSVCQHQPSRRPYPFIVHHTVGLFQTAVSDRITRWNGHHHVCDWPFKNQYRRQLFRWFIRKRVNLEMTEDR